tara:strand:- start:3467 stop:3727 length:261 start_codon:yes stop_codon:yes gene_type:complete
MANTFRYFNLSQMTLGKYNGLTYSWNIKKVVDLTELTNWGSIASAADNYPNLGAGLEKGVVLGNSFSMGDLTSGSVDSTDFGSIAS